MKPAEVAAIHREICKQAKCDQLDKLNYSDPCAACPNGHWGRCGCDPERTIPTGLADTTAPTLEPRRRSTLQPGAIFSLVIYKITGQRTSNCGLCGSRKNQMNQLGWLGCWKNRKIIIGWLVDEARKRGHVIDQQTVFALFTAAIKEL